jgi:hypothetical protein
MRAGIIHVAVFISLHFFKHTHFIRQLNQNVSPPVLLSPLVLLLLDLILFAIVPLLFIGYDFEADYDSGSLNLQF